jgi:hypothetical protein
MYWVGYTIMSTPMFWVLVIIVPVMCLLPDYTIKSYALLLLSPSLPSPLSPLPPLSLPPPLTLFLPFPAYLIIVII